jgi:hypothetical protein
LVRTGCIVAVTSRQEGGLFRAQLKALKSAARRLPSDRQSFIAIQFEDITVADLA